MPIAMKDIRLWLDAEEPDYASAKRKLGSAALPYLLELVRGGDLALASKATYLASLIESDKSMAVLEAAAARDEPVLRVAAASAVRNLTQQHAQRLLNRLRTDADAGVRKVLLKSVAQFRSPQMAAKLQALSEKDPEPFIRELAASTMKTMKSPMKAVKKPMKPVKRKTKKTVKRKKR